MPVPMILPLLVEGARDRILDLGQRLVRASSMSGHEEQVAKLVLAEMQALGYDTAAIDGVGNVIGCLRGGEGHTTLLHAHMDVVDPGDPSLWDRAPFAGDIAEGFLWGRGASDTKGALTAQVYALGLLQEAELEPAGDVYLSAVVGEERSGFGTRYLLKSLSPGVAVIGEPSANTLRRGHRGRFEFVVTWHGRSAHASAPQRGLNPHYSAARFLLALREIPMARDETFGKSTVAPTLAYVDQTNSNVIPSTTTLHLDWRNVPQETLGEARALLQQVLDDTLEPGTSASVGLRTTTIRAYTGLEQTLRGPIPSFCTDPDSPHLLRAQWILEAALERVVDVGIWGFATDGGHLASAGIPCVGFGPGEEAMAHVGNERVAVDQLLEATVGYMALALGMGKWE